MKLIVLLFLLSFCSSVMAQEDGVIRIRKKSSEKSKFKNVSIGFHTGTSLMSIGGKNIQEARNYMHERSKNLDLTYQQYEIYSSGGGSSPSGENIFDFPPTSVLFASYLIIPLHKNFSFVPEIGFRNILAFSQGTSYNARETTGFKYYENKMRTQFRFAHIEAPMKIEAHFNWKIFDPYIKVGFGPVFNVYAKRIVKNEETHSGSVEPDELPEVVKKVLEENNYEMHPQRTSIKRAGVTAVFSLNLGMRFYLSKRTGLCLDYQYMGNTGINAIATYKDGTSYHTSINTNSFSIAIEYKLKK